VATTPQSPGVWLWWAGHRVVWLTWQLGGYHTPIARSLALVGWRSHRMAGCLTLQLSGYHWPIVDIPLTEVLTHTVLFLPLCPEGPANLLPNYRLYPVWPLGRRLSLPGIKVFVCSAMLASWPIPGGFGFWPTFYPIRFELA